MEQATDKRDMGTREFIKYCEDNGYDSVKFHVIKDGRQICTGEAVDIYYDFVRIPVVGEGIVRLSDLEKELGYDIKFRVMDPSLSFNAWVKLDFILRGKAYEEIPEKYKEED